MEPARLATDRQSKSSALNDFKIRWLRWVALTEVVKNSTGHWLNMVCYRRESTYLYGVTLSVLERGSYKFAALWR